MRLSLVCFVSLTATLSAQYTQDMEALTASAAGTIITGQDNYYIPVAGSLDGNVYTYAGNTIGVPVNPNGGNNFYAGISQATGQYARAQRPINLPAGFVHIEVDLLINYLGTGTPGQYPGSLSLQPSTASVFSNLLCGWTQTATAPYTWDCLLQSGTAIVPVGDPAFTALDPNVWHRWGATLDFVNEVYVDFTITNGTTNVTTHYVPPTPLPLGGAGTNLPLPTEFRFFTGGSTGDNLYATDNLVIDYGASYETYGAGCAGSAGVPTLDAQAGSRPTLGGTFTAELNNLPLGLGVIASGFSSQTAVGGSIALPFNLASIGFPGCSLLADPAISQFVVGTGTMATWSFTVPNSTMFTGLRIYQQGVSIDSAAPGGAFTNGAKLTVGY